MSKPEIDLEFYDTLVGAIYDGPTTPLCGMSVSHSSPRHSIATVPCSGSWTPSPISQISVSLMVMTRRSPKNTPTIITRMM
jgi:hypothetical protein